MENDKSTLGKPACSLKTEENFLSHKEAAEYLRVSEKALYNLCSLGEIPYFKFGRRNRYLAKALRDHVLSEQRGGL